MKALRRQLRPTDGATVELTRRELVIFHGAVKEVVNGIQIDERESATRVGGPLPEARELLAELVRVRRRLPSPESAPPRPGYER